MEERDQLLQELDELPYSFALLYELRERFRWKKAYYHRAQKKIKHIIVRSRRHLSLELLMDTDTDSDLEPESYPLFRKNCTFTPG